MIPDTAAPQVEVVVEAMDVVSADPMDELFIDQSNKFITTPTDQETKGVEGSGNNAMEVKGVSSEDGEGKKGHAEGVEGAEGVEKKVITTEGKSVKEVVEEVVKDVEKEEEEEDREFLKHLDATVHNDLCLVYLVSQQVRHFFLPFLSLCSPCPYPFSFPYLSDLFSLILVTNIYTTSCLLSTFLCLFFMPRSIVYL